VLAFESAEHGDCTGKPSGRGTTSAADAADEVRTPEAAPDAAYLNRYAGENAGAVVAQAPTVVAARGGAAQ
jgi:DNA-binding phage protein